MNLRCLFGHKWEIINYVNYNDTSYGISLPSYDLHLQCKKCGNLKEKSFYGGGSFCPERKKYLKENNETKKSHNE